LCRFPSLLLPRETCTLAHFAQNVLGMFFVLSLAVPVSCLIYF
jgi:hypothetical protein